MRRLGVRMCQTWGLFADWRSTPAPACEPPHAPLFQPTLFSILITTLLRQKYIQLTKSGPRMCNALCIVIQCPTLHELCLAQRQTFAEEGFQKEQNYRLHFPLSLRTLHPTEDPTFNENMKSDKTLKRLSALGTPSPNRIFYGDSLEPFLNIF